jgi:hypothetical protein
MDQYDIPIRKAIVACGVQASRWSQPTTQSSHLTAILLIVLHVGFWLGAPLSAMAAAPRRLRDWIAWGPKCQNPY